MRKETFVNAEAQRSVNEPMALVFNPSFNIADQEAEKSPQKKDGKKKRSNYSVAKQHAKELFERFDESGVFHDHGWKPGEPLIMFLKHVIFFMQDYTMEQFKHDLATEMSGLMSDLRIVRECRKHNLNLFEIALVMTWESSKVKANINKLGLKNVHAFAERNTWASKRDLMVCTIEELIPYFKNLGLEEVDWSSPWLKEQNAEVEKAA